MQADHAPMVLSFLYRTFIQPNLRALSEPEAASKLADHLAVLHDLVVRLGVGTEHEISADAAAAAKKR